MSNTELIRELRALTSAGMKDCKDALEETGWDLQKAIDVIKVKGLNIADSRTGRIASEGLVEILSYHGGNERKIMVEINCQTDFVAGSQEFKLFVDHVCQKLVERDSAFTIQDVETMRQGVVVITKENVVVRRWWIKGDHDPTVRVFSYQHSNNKIGVLVTLKAPTVETAKSYDFQKLGEELAMQIAAMNPLAVAPENISQEDKDRQKAIFQTQLQEENKPEKMWDRILEGKFKKWAKEVCLLEQESVIVPKTTVQQVVNNVGSKLGGTIQIIDFIRCQVGEGIIKQQSNLAEEVAKLM
jgi:elongation factor Ts